MFIRVSTTQGGKVRLTVIGPAAPAEGLYPSNWESRTGSYHTVSVEEGWLVYRRGIAGGPPFVHEEQIVEATVLAPRVIEDTMRRLWIVYGEETGEDQFDVKQVFSDDDGESWSAPEVAISGGKWPVVAAGYDGTLLFAAYVDGAVQGYTKQPKEDAPSPVTWKEWNGATLVDLDLEDTTFGVQQERAGSSRWWLHGQRAGETTTTNWSSADGRTWREEEA